MTAMDRQQIFDKVAHSMAELFDLDRSKLTMESKFEDLEITSLDAIDLLVELQAATGKKVSGAGLRQIRSIGDLVVLIEANLAPDPAPKS